MKSSATISKAHAIESIPEFGHGMETEASDGTSRQSLPKTVPVTSLSADVSSSPTLPKQKK
jgi:hypothetical protein